MIGRSALRNLGTTSHRIVRSVDSMYVTTRHATPAFISLALVGGAALGLEITSHLLDRLPCSRLPFLGNYVGER